MRSFTYKGEHKSKTIFSLQAPQKCSEKLFSAQLYSPFFQNWFSITFNYASFGSL